MNEANKEQLIKIIATLKAENEALKEQNKLLLEKLFGKKSEKKKPGHNGPTLFDEAEVEAAKPETQETVEEAKKEDSTEVKTHTRVRGKRKPLPENLPRVDVVIELPEEQRRSSFEIPFLKKFEKK